MPVTLNAVRVEVPRTKMQLFIVQWLLENPAPLAHVLQPGGSWFGIADDDEIRRQVARIAPGAPPSKVRFGVKDAAGRVYRSNRVNLR